MSSVKQEVRELEKRTSEQSFWQEEKGKIPLMVLGAAIYSIGVNLFLRPLHLYSGGFMGFAQLITTLLRNVGIYSGKMDLAGIFYYLMNIPSLIFAFTIMRRRFVAKTILSISLFTLGLTLVPIPAVPILEEKIANCLVAGILSGTGVGLTLRAGSSDGGMDLIGMVMIQARGHYSVGKFNIAANVILYGICLFVFDVPTAIYSLINSVISSTACDRVHTQNINVQVDIITKLEDTHALEVAIMGSMGRGLTRMTASGSYTDENETLFITVISKYEIPKLLAIVKEHDPSAFIILNERIRVEGHFLKKLA